MGKVACKMLGYRQEGYQKVQNPLARFKLFIRRKTNIIDTIV